MTMRAATQFGIAVVTLAVHAWALIPPDPRVWEALQPDGTTIQLVLGENAAREIYTSTIDGGHPVVQDDNGWYVYGVDEKQEKNADWQGERSLLSTNKRVGLDEPPDLVNVNHFLKSASVENELTSPRLVMEEEQPIMEGAQVPNGSTPSTGNVNCLVFLLKFEDHAERTMPSRSEYDVLFNAHDANGNDIRSVHDFFRINSYDKLSLTFDVQDWKVVSGTEQEWAGDNYGINREFHHIVWDTLDAMDIQNRGDWSRYDSNQDGIIDCISVVHSGFSAEANGQDCINGKKNGKHRIRSQSRNIRASAAWANDSGTMRMGPHFVASGVWGSCGNDISRLALMVHEQGHCHGLPDLFQGGVGRGVGNYDVMGFAWGFDRSQRYPNLLNPWSRIILGWVSPIELNENAEYNIGTSHYNDDIYIVKHGFPEGEFLLIENRQKKLGDALIPGDSGLLIWHIDTLSKQRAKGYNGHPGQEGWPGNGMHYQIALLQADGSYDLEKNRNNGDEGDAWSRGRSLLPGPATDVARGSLGTILYPNTDTYQGGIIRNTGVKIDEISESKDTMSFRFTRPATLGQAEGSRDVGEERDTLGGNRERHLRKRKLRTHQTT